MAALSAVPLPEPAGAIPAESAEGTWPHSLSHDAHLRVSDVLTQVSQEFPALTSSKLRFLDSNGLVSPVRTASGYRQYSPADVERLRFVLRQQRDHYRPLSVIADYLAQLDAGLLHEPVSLHEVTRQEPLLAASELASAASASPALVDELTVAAIIAQTSPGRYERSVVEIVVAAQAYVDAGGDLRALKTLVRAAQREAHEARELSRPARTRGHDAEADAQVRQRTDAAIAMFSAWVHAEVDR